MHALPECWRTQPTHFPRGGKAAPLPAQPVTHAKHGATRSSRAAPLTTPGRADPPAKYCRPKLKIGAASKGPESANSPCSPWCAEPQPLSPGQSAGREQRRGSSAWDGRRAQLPRVRHQTHRRPGRCGAAKALQAAGQAGGFASTSPRAASEGTPRLLNPLSLPLHPVWPGSCVLQVEFPPLSQHIYPQDLHPIQRSPQPRRQGHTARPETKQHGACSGSSPDSGPPRPRAARELMQARKGAPCFQFPAASLLGLKGSQAPLKAGCQRSRGPLRSTRPLDGNFPSSEPRGIARPGTSSAGSLARGAGTAGDQSSIPRQERGELPAHRG